MAAEADESLKLGRQVGCNNYMESHFVLANKAGWLGVVGPGSNASWQR